MTRFAAIFAAALTLAAAAPLPAAPTINGARSGGEGYLFVSGSGRSTRTGFGTSNDASGIYVTSDTTHLYFFIRGRVSTTNSNDALMVLLNTSAERGAAANTNIGRISGAPHVPWNIASGSQSHWRVGFEVDHMWIAHTGTSASNWFVRKASYTGAAPTQSQIGQLTSQAGTAMTFANGETHAVVNDGGLDSGWEFSVPRTLLGDFENSDQIQVMAIILNRNNGFFSDDSSPITYASGNIAQNRNLSVHASGPPWFRLEDGPPPALPDFGSTWKYLVTPTDQGTAWRDGSFDDSAWPSGAARLGYGGDGEVTAIGFGGDPSNKYITTYFRHTFTVADPSQITSLIARIVRDDGAVAYLNGTEIFRTNMPGGPITWSTLAVTSLGGADEQKVHSFAIDPALLAAGNNTIAVEVHQSSPSSSDLGFDFALDAAEPALMRGPYLQMGAPDGMTVRWRTDAAVQGRVAYGGTSATLTASVDGATTTPEHEIRVTGLAPSTGYHYSIGDGSRVLAGGDDLHTFKTSPPHGSVVPVNAWVMGDFGTGDSGAASVRDSFAAYTSDTFDFWVWLGDNAYNDGLDEEFQLLTFNMYDNTMRRRVSWPGYGNHDSYSANAATETGAYFEFFTMPKLGEAGGVPSGSKAYYSFDYANIHFVCLDSMDSDRTPGGPMLTWLAADLAATTQEWIIVYFHHPPYSKGSHDSDLAAGPDIRMREMRENAGPILEAGGADVVFVGHSHNYERSFLMNGHYGVSSTLLPAMILDGGDGRETGTGEYTKPAGITANNGTVYVVAGSGGKLNTGLALNHPIMYAGEETRGSVLLTVNGDRLDSTYIRSTGVVGDWFTIQKDQLGMNHWSLY